MQIGHICSIWFQKNWHLNYFNHTSGRGGVSRRGVVSRRGGVSRKGVVCRRGGVCRGMRNAKRKVTQNNISDRLIKMAAMQRTLVFWHYHRYKLMLIDQVLEDNPVIETGLINNDTRFSCVLTCTVFVLCWSVVPEGHHFIFLIMPHSWQIPRSKWIFTLKINTSKINTNNKTINYNHW